MERFTLDIGAMIDAAAKPTMLSSVHHVNGRAFPIVSRLFTGVETARACARKLVLEAKRWTMPPGEPALLEKAVPEVIDRSAKLARTALSDAGKWVIAASLADGEPLAEFELRSRLKPPHPNRRIYILADEEARRHVPATMFEHMESLYARADTDHASMRKWAMVLGQRHVSEMGQVFWLDTLHIFGVYRRNKGDDAPPSLQEFGIVSRDAGSVCATVALVALFYQNDIADEVKSVGLSDVYMEFDRQEGTPNCYAEIDSTAEVDMLLTPHRRQTFESAGFLLRSTR